MSSRHCHRVLKRPFAFHTLPQKYFVVFTSKGLKLTNRSFFLLLHLKTNTPMKKLFSWKYSENANSFGLFLLRLTMGGLMIKGGYGKLDNFGKMIEDGKNGLPMGWVSPIDFLSAEVSLSLTVFAEFICAILIVIGLLTRLATIPAIINMAVAVFIAHKGDILGQGSFAALFMGGYLALLFTGPGKFSLDRMIGK
jgi:putative oxidoreductase